MQKRAIKFEVNRGEHLYQFECDPTSPLGEIFDALCEMQQYVMDKMNELSPKKQEEKQPDPKQELNGEEKPKDDS